MMPLTTKGQDILESMEQTYGSKEKAKQVFYASKNAGVISGVDARVPAPCEQTAYLDAVRRGDGEAMKHYLRVAK